MSYSSEVGPILGMPYDDGVGILQYGSEPMFGVHQISETWGMLFIHMLKAAHRYEAHCNAEDKDRWPLRCAAWHPAA